MWCDVTRWNIETRKEKTFQICHFLSSFYFDYFFFFVFINKSFKCFPKIHLKIQKSYKIILLYFFFLLYFHLWQKLFDSDKFLSTFSRTLFFGEVCFKFWFAFAFCFLVEIKFVINYLFSLFLTSSIYHLVCFYMKEKINHDKVLHLFSGITFYKPYTFVFNKFS